MSRLAGGPEFDFISALLKGAKTEHPLVRVGPGDDCAVVGDLAISTDSSVEGVHFRRDWITAREIGWRAAAAALSDLAAVAAEPVGVLCSLVVPPRDRDEFAADVMAGAIAAAEAVGAVLLGGDTTGGELFMLDVVVVGKVERPVLRAGAQPGDELWVTGALGGAAAAVAALQSGQTPARAARARYAAPSPRIRQALWLHNHVDLHAMIDLSDGLYGDVAHLAAASNCGIEILADVVPIDVAAGASQDDALRGGDDYELCFAISAMEGDGVRDDFMTEFGIPMTRIGQVTRGGEVVERTGDGVARLVERGGYQHFRDSGR